MIVYGKQIFNYIINNHPNLINEIFLAKEIDRKLFLKISKLNHKIIKLDPKKAQSLSRGGNHQGFLLNIEELSFTDFSDLKKFNFLLILHSITDVGNIGAIVRSAYSLGVDGIVISGVNSIKIEGVVRSSSGAIFELPIAFYKNTLNLANELKQVGFYLYGADMSGEDIRDIKIMKKKALFLGSEGEGLTKRVIEKLDKIVSIKMEREFESLNVSVAAALLCDRIR